MKRKTRECHPDQMAEGKLEKINANVAVEGDVEGIRILPRIETSPPIGAG